MKSEAQSLPVVVPMITCGKCGAAAADHLFYVDGLGFDLPQAEFRCPGCGYHWERIRNPRAGKLNFETMDFEPPILCREVVQGVL